MLLKGCSPVIRFCTFKIDRSGFDLVHNVKKYFYAKIARR